MAAFQVITEVLTWRLIVLGEPVICHFGHSGWRDIAPRFSSIGSSKHHICDAATDVRPAVILVGHVQPESVAGHVGKSHPGSGGSDGASDCCFVLTPATVTVVSVRICFGVSLVTADKSPVVMFDPTTLSGSPFRCRDGTVMFLFHVCPSSSVTKSTTTSLEGLTNRTGKEARFRL